MAICCYRAPRTGTRDDRRGVGRTPYAASFSGTLVNAPFSVGQLGMGDGRGVPPLHPLEHRCHTLPASDALDADISLIWFKTRAARGDRHNCLPSPRTAAASPPLRNNLPPFTTAPYLPATNASPRTLAKGWTFSHASAAACALPLSRAPRPHLTHRSISTLPTPAYHPRLLPHLSACRSACRLSPYKTPLTTHLCRAIRASHYYATQHARAALTRHCNTAARRARMPPLAAAAHLLLAAYTSRLHTLAHRAAPSAQRAAALRRSCPARSACTWASQ